MKLAIWVDKRTSKIKTEYCVSKCNLISEKTGLWETTYEYTAENRLSVVRQQGVVLMAALYDGDNNRLFTMDYTGICTAPDKFDGCGKEDCPFHNEEYRSSCFSEELEATEDGTEVILPDSGVTEPEEETSAAGEAMNSLASLVSERAQKLYTTTEYVNDIIRSNEQVLAELNSAGNITDAYIYGNNRIADDVGDGTLYYLYDRTGSVTRIATEWGRVQESYTYDPYGNLTYGIPDSVNYYGYNGESTNLWTGLQYLRARYYDMSNGNFLSEDTYAGQVASPLTLNRYTYVGNNPVNYVDPSGHRMTNQFSQMMKLDGGGGTSALALPQGQTNIKSESTSSKQTTTQSQTTTHQNSVKPDSNSTKKSESSGTLWDRFMAGDINFIEMIAESYMISLRVETESITAQAIGTNKVISDTVEFVVDGVIDTYNKVKDFEICGMNVVEILETAVATIAAAAVGYFVGPIIAGAIAAIAGVSVTGIMAVTVSVAIAGFAFGLIDSGLDGGSAFENIMNGFETAGWWGTFSAGIGKLLQWDKIIFPMLGQMDPQQMGGGIANLEDFFELFEGGTKTGTIWDNIRGTADNMPGTEIPATFQIDLEGHINYVNPETGTNTLWTNANATEHMGEYVSRFGLESDSIEVRSQIMLESYSASLNDAMADLMTKEPGRHFGIYGNWELGINTETGVVYHARMIE